MAVGGPSPLSHEGHIIIVNHSTSELTGSAVNRGSFVVSDSIRILGVLSCLSWVVSSLVPLLTVWWSDLILYPWSRIEQFVPNSVCERNSNFNAK